MPAKPSGRKTKPTAISLAECPNCMRVKLYLKEVSDGAKPADDSDIKNNASCIK